MQRRIHRLVRLVDFLSLGRARTASALAEESGVSRRTIFRDLAVLRDAGLPIGFDEERGGFLLDRQPYLRPTELTLTEALALLALTDAPSHQAGPPFQKSARAAALKLLSILPAKLREELGHLESRVGVEIGPVNPHAVDERHHDAILRAIHNRHKIRIVYNSLYEDDTIKTLLSPYCLHFHRRSWYVIGRSSLHRAVRTFNVARIETAEQVDATFDIPLRFSLDRHFGQAWSMIPNRSARYDVVIRFQKKVARNVREVQWHRSQRLTWNDHDSTLDFAVTVDGLDEIVWWVLGYGKEAEVLQPPNCDSKFVSTPLRWQINTDANGRSQPDASRSHSAERTTVRADPEGESSHATSVKRVE